MSRVTVMDPLGGPGEAQGLRRLRYVVVAGPPDPAWEPAEGAPEDDTPEREILRGVLAWLEHDHTCMVVSHGTVVLALDPDTGACLWHTGTVPGAKAEGVGP